MPLRGHAIWDHDQLSRFLDGYEEIRGCYAAWITPGRPLGDEAFLTKLEGLLNRVLKPKKPGPKPKKRER